jgi:hypothetical protein
MSDTRGLRTHDLTGRVIPRCSCGKPVYADAKCYGLYQYQECGVTVTRSRGPRPFARTFAALQQGSHDARAARKAGR